MADNEKTVIDAQLNIDDVNVDEKALNKALQEVQSAMQKNQGKINGIRTRLNASKRYKGRAQDQRDLESLLKEQSNLAVREGQITAQMAKRVPVSGDKSSKKSTAERKWREQISREERLEWDKQKEAARLEQQKTLETAKLEGKIQQEQEKNKGKLEVQIQKDKAAAERQAEAQRAAAEKQTAWIELEKEKEKRRNRALDLKEQAKSEAKTANTASKTVKNLLDRARKQFSNGVIGKFSEKLYNTLFSRLARRLLTAVFNSVKTGLQDLYKWSQSNNGLFANAVDRIKEDLRYVSDILGSILGPFIEVMAPHIRSIADAFAVAAEKANQFFATLLGRNGYYKAIRVAQQYAGIQNQLLGFDELNVLKGDNDTGGGMFEWKPWDGGELTKVGQKLLKSSKAMLAIGGLLMVFGHPVLGAGLIASGIVTGLAASQEGSSIQQKISDTLDTIGAMVSIYGPYAFALGALLAFSGHPGIGIPIMAGTLTAGAISWNSIVELMKGPIGLLTALVGASMIPIGALLAFGSPVAHLGLGLAMMLAGGVATVSAIAINWNWLTEKVSAVGTGIANVVSGIWNWIVEKFNALKEFVKNWIAAFKEGISKYITPIVDIVRTAVTSVMSLISPIFNTIGNIIERVKSLWSWLRDTFDRDYSLRLDSPAKKAFDNYHYLRYNDPLGLGLYASGGTPTTGSLFYAGEAGPELVTSMNNQSTVYNDDQLAGSLASANSGVVTAVYDMANAVVNAIERKNTSISVNDVRSAINSQALRYGL